MARKVPVEDRMRYGFTTGSCSAAAAKAAAYMLICGIRKEKIVIGTPKGIDFNADIVDITLEERSVTCGVVKDGGDDPDVTAGHIVYATVSYALDKTDGIYIDGGTGVGRVTRPGLDQPVGEAAINSVPREMIEKEVNEVKKLLDCNEPLSVVISVPDGEELADKTFNPRLGIVGGISILGTSGIVEPMSTQAIKDTIAVELRQQKALGNTKVAVAPGNYGLDFMKREYDFDLERAVKCSNYIGDMIDMASETGVEKVLLIGHIGKLIKVSGGIMNTHSKVADCRMELMFASAIRAGIDRDTALSILDCISTDEAYSIVLATGLEQDFMACVMERIEYHLRKRAAGRIDIECIVFSNENGVLGMTENALSLLGDII